MRYRLICVGKLRERYVAEAVDDFARRLRRHETLDIDEVPASTAGDERRVVLDESSAVMRRIDPADRVWLLERTGTELGSAELAQRLQALAIDGTSRLTLVVAGTFGAGAQLAERADFLWSLSPLTFLHEWARALVLEQLYRATKITRGEPYHH